MNTFLTALNAWGFFAGIAIAIGLLDFIFKGFKPFEQLPGYQKGWSWHTIVAGLYFFIVFLTAVSESNWIYLFGALGIADEDFGYYIFASIYYRRLKWNDWLFESKEGYYITVLFLNIVMFAGFLFIKCV